MITELRWDSALLGIKIGELDLLTVDTATVENMVVRAKQDNYKYIICRLASFDILKSRLLENLGFYISDIGVTWKTETSKFVFRETADAVRRRQAVRVADINDIPHLEKLSKSLFLSSRFYNDPFFSSEQADRLYSNWIANSVKGEAADRVFFLPDAGFITCKRTGVGKGTIVLIGIRPEARRSGIGRALIENAVTWFAGNGMNTISVKTQLKNLDSMNFYSSLDFSIEGHDLILSMML